MLARDGRKVTIVDVNADCFDLARRYFRLPPSVLCHIADGRDHILSNPARYDAIVMDAYLGRHVPAHLQTLAFLRLASVRLERRGMLLANVYVQHDGDPTPDQMAEAARDVWPKSVSWTRLAITIAMRLSPPGMYTAFGCPGCACHRPCAPRKLHTNLAPCGFENRARLEPLRRRPTPSRRRQAADRRIHGSLKWADKAGFAATRYSQVQAKPPTRQMHSAMKIAWVSAGWGWWARQGSNL